MTPLIFIYPHDDIFQSVKLEASLYAERKYNPEGDIQFEILVFDEEYFILFRQLFFEAQAEVTVALSAYKKDVPVEPDYFETKDFSKNRDYIFYLSMPDDWNFHLTHPVDIKIKEFLTAYIMYRWLETKVPQDAAMYLQRATSVLSDVKRMLENRTKSNRLLHGYWEI